MPGVKLRGVEKAPGLKDNLLGYILAGDSARIVALSDAEIPSPLRCAILARLTPIAAEEEEIVHDYVALLSEPALVCPVPGQGGISTSAEVPVPGRRGLLSRQSVAGLAPAGSVATMDRSTGSDHH